MEAKVVAEEQEEIGRTKTKKRRMRRKRRRSQYCDGQRCSEFNGRHCYYQSGEISRKKLGVRNARP
ncbi:hypothetical protein V3C99_000820, partial [Haemonchus contortus]